MWHDYVYTGIKDKPADHGRQLHSGMDHGVNKTQAKLTFQNYLNLIHTIARSLARTRQKREGERERLINKTRLTETKHTDKC